MEKTVIEALLDERDTLLKRDGGVEADKIEAIIQKAIRKNFDKYEVDYIIETLTRFGCAPNIVYDDNGLFAISEDGMQPVVTGKQKIHGAVTIFVERKQWKKTIREALKYHLNIK